MNYLIGNINDYNNSCIPIYFNKNEYSKAEYSLIKEGLSRYYKVKDFRVFYTKNGKPYLNNDIYISISHSDNLVVVAFSKEEIGIDLESIKPFSNDMKKLLDIPLKASSQDSLIEFLKRESVIKLENLTMSKMNDLDLSKYSFYIKKMDNYVMVICKRSR